MNAPIRIGFKQTNVGVIPHDWHVLRVDQIATVKGGKRLPLGRSLTQQNTPYPYIRVADMRNGTVVTDDVFFVPEDVFPAIRNYRIFRGDLYISVAGTLGLVGRIPDELEGANLTENADKITDLKCDRDFLFFCFSSERIQSEIHSKRTVGAQPKLAIQQIEAFELALPPTGREQRAIATALSDADALIASLDALIAKKRDLKQAAMQQLLTGKTRMPGFKGEWEMKRLGDHASFHKGKGLPKSAIADAGRFFCIHYGELFTTYGVSIDEVVSHTNRSDGTFLSRRNDVLMPTSDVTPNGLAKASCIKIDDVILGGDTLVIRTPETSLNGVFLAAQIRYQEDQILRFVTGSTVYHLYAADMRKFEFIAPSVAEQNAIVSALSDMDDELTALEAKRDKTRAIKQGMMLELLTGRIRLV